MRQLRRRTAVLDQSHPASGQQPPATPPPEGKPGMGTACALLTETEATTALGADPSAGAEVVDGTASSCKFGNYPSVLTLNLSAAMTLDIYADLWGFEP